MFETKAPAPAQHPAGRVIYLHGRPWARDVIEHVEPSAAGPLAGPRRGPTVPRDLLDPAARVVLEQVPARGGRGPAAIAVGAGVDLDTAVRCLGALSAGGFIRRCDHGWRLMKPD